MSHLLERTLTASLAADCEQKLFLAETLTALALSQPSAALTIRAAALFSQPAARIELTRVAAPFSHLRAGTPATSSLAAALSHLLERTLTASLAADFEQKLFLAATFTGATFVSSVSAKTEIPMPRNRATAAVKLIALRITLSPNS